MNLAGFVDAEGSMPEAPPAGIGGQQGSVEVGGNAGGGVRVDGLEGRTSGVEKEGPFSHSLPHGFDRSVDSAPSSHPTMTNGISHARFEPAYDSWNPAPPAAHAESSVSDWDDPRPVPMVQPATEGWDSVRPTMAVDYGWDAPRPIASGGEW